MKYKFVPPPTTVSVAPRYLELCWKGYYRLGGQRVISTGNSIEQESTHWTWNPLDNGNCFNYKYPLQFFICCRSQKREMNGHRMMSWECGGGSSASTRQFDNHVKLSPATIIPPTWTISFREPSVPISSSLSRSRHVSSAAGAASSSR